MKMNCCVEFKALGDVQKQVSGRESQVVVELRTGGRARGEM